MCTYEHTWNNHIHTTRAASVGAAAKAGASLKTLLKVAGWSKEMIFTSFYKRQSSTTLSQNVMDGTFVVHKKWDFQLWSIVHNVSKIRFWYSVTCLTGCSKVCHYPYFFLKSQRSFLYWRNRRVIIRKWTRYTLGGCRLIKIIMSLLWRRNSRPSLTELLIIIVLSLAVNVPWIQFSYCILNMCRTHTNCYAFCICLQARVL